MVCFDFLEQCRSASGTLVRAVQRSQAEELLLSLSFLFSSSQALISQRPSSTSSYRVRHHSFVSPERYIVAIVTWSSKGARTALIKVLFHVPEVFEPWHFESPVEWLRFRDSNASGVARWDIRFTNRRPISTASSSPQFDPVRHALDIATGIVEAPWRRLSFTGKTRYSLASVWWPTIPDSPAFLP